MAQVINTNIASLNAQRNLNNTGNELRTSLTRLSSGLRVNSAKDDAAGLAIAERFTTQIRGLTVAARNANDGISLSQVAEGAMAEIGNNLQRIRELGVQSANYTNSEGDREALNNEVNELINEINRVAAQTDFNGTKLLDGSFSGAVFQIGANSGQTIAITQIVDANASALGTQRFAKDGAITGVSADAATAGEVTNLKIGDTDIAAFSVSGEDDLSSVAAAINAQLDEHGVFAELNEAGDEIVLSAIRAGGELIEVTGDNVTGITNLLAGEVDVDDKTLADVDVSDFVGASRAMEIVSAALTEVNTGRSEMGAIQNRFESVIANLTISVENLSASRSRIEDADFAAETASLTRAQILQQAGTAMLAQANSMPQSVLSLLQ